MKNHSPPLRAAARPCPVRAGPGAPARRHPEPLHACTLARRKRSLDAPLVNFAAKPFARSFGSRGGGGDLGPRDPQVRYAPHLPFILKGLTCTFLGGMRTGIVGRTGSGKSTLIQSLFRIVDPNFGQVLIDGIDICTVGLHDLRTRLSIIPQDPVMFKGIVGSNLDPLGEYTDEQIWEALDSCHLGEEVRKNELKLDYAVTENGENWSIGQRQLVCLGRVLLKKSKILFLDEATSSLDPTTDNLIQKAIRRQFDQCTVITVAHQIASVLDSDMVLVLDNGKIVEHDTPANLLQDSSSSFSKLVREYTSGTSYEQQRQPTGS